MRLGLGKGAPAPSAPIAFVKPPDLPAWRQMPVSVAGHRVTVDVDTVTDCYAYNVGRITAGELWVDSVNGLDANPGTEAQPKQTIKNAMADVLGPTRIYLKAGEYDPTSFLFRNISISQVVGGNHTPILKHVSPAPGVSRDQVVWRCPAPLLSAQAWVADGGGFGVYSTVLGGTTLPHRVVRTNVLDTYGFPVRLRRYTSLADLRLGGIGWFWDLGTRTLYVALNGLNVEANKANLRSYNTLSNGFARFTVNNAAVLLENLTIEGIEIRVVNVAQAPAVFQSQVWTKDCVMFASDVCGVFDQGAYSVADGNRIHATGSDNILHSDPAQGFDCTATEINNFCTKAGDTDTDPAPAQGDVFNGSSAHTGHVVRYGGRYWDSYGGAIGDTNRVNQDHVAWFIGCDLRYAYGPTRSYGYLFNVTGADNMSRKAYMDSCTSIGNQLGDISANQTGVGTTAQAYLFNTLMPSQLALNGATIEQYARGAPA